MCVRVHALKSYMHMPFGFTWCAICLHFIWIVENEEAGSNRFWNVFESLIIFTTQLIFEMWSFNHCFTHSHFHIDCHRVFQMMFILFPSGLKCWQNRNFLAGFLSYIYIKSSMCFLPGISHTKSCSVQYFIVYITIHQSSDINLQICDEAAIGLTLAFHHNVIMSRFIYTICSFAHTTQSD